MNDNIDIYTEQQIQTAIAAASIDTALALWREKDWQTYSNTRDALVALIRAGRGAEVRLPQMQFICFVNSHLLRCFNKRMPDSRMFMAALPPSRSTDHPSWDVATRGAFLSDVL